MLVTIILFWILFRGKIRIQRDNEMHRKLLFERRLQGIWYACECHGRTCDLWSLHYLCSHRRIVQVCWSWMECRNTQIWGFLACLFWFFLFTILFFVFYFTILYFLVRLLITNFSFINEICFKYLWILCRSLFIFFIVDTRLTQYHLNSSR